MPETPIIASQPPITDRMQALLQQWQVTLDRRAIFLDCYTQMTGNMLLALEAGQFNDRRWVSALLHRFAAYYFEALEAYDQGLPTPLVWQMAHDAARQPKTMVLQNLLLGVNAHINYDLVLALVELLEPDWPHLSQRQRDQRYADHCQVNEVIGRTIDTVQDDLIECLIPAMDIIDKLMGPLDEWLIGQLIRRWRDEVWQHALSIVETADLSTRQQLRQNIEAATLKRANAILHSNSPAGIKHLL